jgi:uncharacterized protein
MIMIYRNIVFPSGNFFLFGPRCSGKSYWLRYVYADHAGYIDLLEASVFNRLCADPQRLSEYISEDQAVPVIIDEIQKIPELLDEVHRLIERNRRLQFILTGSSPRKLRRASSNLLGGRASVCHVHPLSAMELADEFDFRKALTHGLLPSIYDKEKKIDPVEYLAGYIETYLREEILQEGLTRNISAFSRFLEVASFSQGEVLNVAEVARECSVNRKLAESYFQILEDLLIAYRIPVFTKKAKRRVIQHSKFYLFDVGVYRALRPKGPLDTPELIDGAAIETLVIQNLKAYIQNRKLMYSIYYWRTVSGNEVDFVLYGDDGLVAIEVKRKKTVSRKDFAGLKAFKEDYPAAKCYMLYGGDKQLNSEGVPVVPLPYALTHLDAFL